VGKKRGDEVKVGKLLTVNDKISDPENNGYIESWNKIP